MSVPDVSIIIPIHNRGDLVRYTLESVRRGAGGLNVEVIVVDDGSDKPALEDLTRLGYADSVRVLRQENQGLLFARLAGFASARGRYVLFLDSDDLIAPGKLPAQVEAMEAHAADVSYTDVAYCELSGAFDELRPQPSPPERVAGDSADFFINVQPAPHSPLFRSDFLGDVVHNAYFPPSRLYNPVAEIWFYHNAAPRPAKVVHVAGPFTIAGRHAGARLTNHWERLCVASLAVMEAFARLAPSDTPAALEAHRLVGAKAFRSWRALPRDFSTEIRERHLALWRKLAPDAPPETLGGRGFGLLAQFLGIERTGRWLQRLRGKDYATCRTMSDDELRPLLAELPPP